MANIFVDWITATYPHSEMRVERGFQAVHYDADRFAWWSVVDIVTKKAIPHNGYTQAWETLNGAIIQFNGQREDMGVNVVLSGKALSVMGWKFPLRMAVAHGHVSRIDVTCDVIDKSFDCEGLYKLVLNGICTTTARSVSYITSNTGETLYIGKRSSDRMLRIYDKGGESGGERGEHWRIEAEIKGRAAMSVASRMLQDMASAGALFRSILDCPHHKGYSVAIGQDYVDCQFETEKKRRDTEGWLFGLVAKVMADQERIKPGILAQFVDHVTKII